MNVKEMTISILLIIISLIPCSPATKAQLYTEPAPSTSTGWVDYTTESIDYTVSSGGKETSPSYTYTDCSIVELESGDKTFLKERCYSKWGEEYYKCPFTDKYYRFYTMRDCDTFFATSHHCKNDPHSYQMCGHQEYYDSHAYLKVKDYEYFCSAHICDYCISEGDPRKISSLSCGIEEGSGFTCYMADIISQSRVCDLECDCPLCDDEEHCNGVTYGMRCTQWGREMHIPPYQICDGRKDCENGEDEALCAENAVGTCKRYTYSYDTRRYVLETRYLQQNQMCHTPKNRFLNNVCDSDDRIKAQVNCTDPHRVAMYCQVNGYNTSISVLGLCKEGEMCDDNYHNFCLERKPLTLESWLHINKICDNIPDYDDGFDERPELCSNILKRKCIRRFIRNHGQRKPLPILYDWVMDGKRDCEYGEDEDISYWEKCESEKVSRYIDKGENCENVFMCPGGSGYVTFDEMCDKVESCDGNQRENKVCDSSRSTEVDITGTMTYFNNEKVFPYCLKGLEDLQRSNSNCIRKIHQPTDSFPIEIPVRNSVISIPMKTDFNCGFLHGEMYVYMSCLGLCSNNDPCPLRHTPHDSCSNKIKYSSVTNANRLSVLFKTKGQYHNEFFGCDNKRCIAYSDVCDLEDDCGDGSDERNCTNHFKCSDSRGFIPLTSVCDGVYNCNDLSDECAEGCNNNKNLMEAGMELLIICVTVGILAFFLNLFNLIDTAIFSTRATTLGGMMNKLMVNLITMGDLLMGVYLILVGVANVHHGDDYCTQQFQWLSSTWCALLGTLSTVGSQLSLFAMTTLSVFRVSFLGQLIPPPASSRKSRVIMITTVLVTVFSSLAIGMAPLMPQFEDYFVNGLHYPNNPLFTASVNKAKHAEILAAYHGRKNLIANPAKESWNMYRNLIDEMFSGNNSKRGDSLHFYGNSGVCLFKFLVTPDDPQKEFSLVILTINFCCFAVVSLCYATILTVSKSSSRRVDNNQSSAKMEAKITTIILTDFLCWIPLSVVCFIHYGEVIDATPWYPYFSTILLPLNSVINPILYNRRIEGAVTYLARTSIYFTTRSVSSFRAAISSKAEDEVPEERAQEQETAL